MLSERPLSKKATVLLLAGICLATFICLSPTLSNDYVNFDDTKYLVFNPAVKDLSFESIKRLFTTFKGEQYHYLPLTLLTFSVEYHYHNLVPRIYHANNLFLHILNTLCVYWLVLLLFKRWMLAGCVAFLFGIHPMHVESVAWVSQRKDVLYSLFYLLALIQYVSYLDNKKTGNFIVSYFLFLFSLLSKPMAITLPLILLLIDWQRQRKISFKIILEKIHFFLASAVILYITTLEKNIPVIEFEKGYTWFEHYFIGCHNIVQYVVKALTPFYLSAYYPLPNRVNGVLSEAFQVAPLLCAFFIAAFVFFCRGNRIQYFGVFFFLFSIFPVLNVYPIGNILMADHYTYLSYIGIFLIFTEAFLRILQSQRFNKDFKSILMILALLWCAILFQQSYKRTYVWINSETLWSDVIDKFPNEPLAYYNLADYYMRTNRVRKAMVEYNNAIKVDPRYFAAYNNRGNLKIAFGELDEAEKDYISSISINPKHGTAYLNLASLYKYQKKYDQAIEVINKLLMIKPNYPGANELKLRLHKAKIEHE